MKVQVKYKQVENFAAARFFRDGKPILNEQERKKYLASVSAALKIPLANVQDVTDLPWPNTWAGAPLVNYKAPIAREMEVDE
jgi:hypothetical protein